MWLDVTLPKCDNLTISLHYRHQELGNGTGSGNPYRLQVGVLAGMGMGSNSTTRHLQNKFKNIIFGPELSQL